MTRTERVTAALRFEKPDRIPQRDIFEAAFVEHWRQARGRPADADIYEAYPMIDVRDTFRAWHAEGPFPSRAATLSTDGVTSFIRDDWGRMLRIVEGALSKEVVECAIQEKTVLERITFEPANVESRFSPLIAGLEQRKEREVLFAGVLGLFMGCQRLRGELAFVMDTVDDPSFARELVGRLMPHIRDVGLLALSTSETWDTGIWVYDELAMTNAPWISPETFEALFLEPYRVMIRAWKERSVKNVILHCDGHSRPLWELFIEAGFTGIQSCNPSAGMYLPELKRTYGNRLALVGGIDNVNILRNGSETDIESHVKSVLEAAKDGGVIVGPHSIAGDIPVENYELYAGIIENYCV